MRKDEVQEAFFSSFHLFIYFFKALLAIWVSRFISVFIIALSTCWFCLIFSLSTQRQLEGSTGTDISQLCFEDQSPERKMIVTRLQPLRHMPSQQTQVESL